jgi:glycosyltransferase involved in cell wall biosynthesis
MKVSVAICTYNRPEFLSEAIKSILCQRYKDFKILVLDNASSEKTRRAAEAFGDSRIIYHSNGQNLGAWRNMNQAFELCDTEYLNIFHDDDRQLPWMLEHETAILDSMPKVGVVVSSKNHIMGSKKISLPKWPRGAYYPKYEFIKAMWRGKSRVVPPSPMFRMSEVRKYDIRFNVDTGTSGDLYMWSYMNQYLNVYTLKYPLLEYREHPGSTSSNNWLEENHYECTFVKIDELLQKLRDENHLDITSHNKARSYLAEVSLCQTMREFINGAISLDELMDKKAFFDGIGWRISDRRFRYVVAKSILNHPINMVGMRKMSVGDFLREMRRVEERIKIPIERKIGWFLKFVLIKRWLKL